MRYCMPKKWYAYTVLLSTIVWNLYVESIGYMAYAREIVPYTKVSADEIDDLKYQLKLMEEAFLKQQEQMKQMQELALKQQEQIQTLKDRIDTVIVQATAVKDGETKPTLAEKEKMKHTADAYLFTEETRKKTESGLSGVLAEYTPDDEKYVLSIKSIDSNYSLRAGSKMQFRYTFHDKDSGKADVMNLTLRRAELYFGGNIYSKEVQYVVALAAEKFTLQLLDFYVFWTPHEEFNARIGFFKVPFGRQRMASSSRLLLQDRSITASAFTQGRDSGLDIYGFPLDGRMEYHVAVFQGAGEDPTKWDNGDNLDNKFMYVLNLRYNPFGRYDYYDETDIRYSDTLKATIGTAVVFNGKVNDEKIRDTDTILGVVDFGIKYRGFSWNNEYYIRTVNPEDGDTIDSDGFFTQAGYFVMPKKLEIALRYSMLDPDKDTPNDLQREYSLGLNYYFRTHRSKIQSDITHFVTEVGEHTEHENIFRLQYHILF